ncbi:MAG: OsmC family protein [Bacteroidota bacterium]
MKRHATSTWNGTGKEGSGTLTTQSGVFNEQPYSFELRFLNEDGQAGTNPEELIAAAHAGCFNMALSFQLTGAGFTPESLDTKAVVTLEKADGGPDFAITTVHLTLDGRVPGIEEAQFMELVTVAKENCPVSKVLNAEITIDATLH